MQAVQRLRAYDEQRIKNICGIRNIYRKSKELAKRIEAIRTFRDKATKRENTWRETEGKRCVVSALKLYFRYY